MQTINQWIGAVSNVVWGLPIIVLLLGTGIYLTVLLRGLQFRQLGPALHLAFIKRREEGAQGDISHFQALMTALAATVGVGNIAGVATAIAAGGPGALFWMWMTGLLGMATKYSEALLGVRYREVDARGNMAGGPMYYLKNGIGGRAGKALGWAFALFAAIAAFGIGNMVQSNSVADALNSSFGVRPLWTGLGLAILAGGGFLGATVREGIRWGVARGIFSNESGLGTGGIAAAAAQSHAPASQALVSMTQTFIDTIVVCSVTGFVIIATGAWTQVDPTTGHGLTGAPLTTTAFSTGLPGNWGGSIVALGLAFFAFSTILGWSYYGERAIEYLLGVRVITPYRVVFVVAAFLGAFALEFGEAERAGFAAVWAFSDVMNGAMAIPNLVGLLVLSRVVVSETRHYRSRS